MFARIRKAMKMRGTRGMTILEVLIATTILSISLISMAMMISAGLLQLQTMRIQRTASNCARMVMEYLETVPANVIYTWSAGVSMSGDFSSGGVTQLNDFVNSNDESCRELSDSGTSLGNKVNLKYEICPGCFSATQCDAVTSVCWTSCYYFYRVRLCYKAPALGGIRQEVYFTKKQSTDCTDVDSCGEGVIPGTLRNCSLTDDCAW